MDAVNAFNHEVRGARGRAAAGQAGRFSRCPRAFRAPSRGGDASCPGFRGGGPEAEERSRWGADPAPLPRHAPSPPSGLRRLRLLQRGPCAPGPVIGSAGPRSRQGLQRSAGGRADLGAGVPAGWGTGAAAAACALLLLRPPRVGRWTLIPAGGEFERVSTCLLA